MNLVYLHRTLRFILVISVIVAGALALFFVSKVTYPFIIGFLIAFMMNPLVNFFQERVKMPRALAVIIALALIMSLFAGLITLLIVEIASGAEYLAKVVPEHLVTLIDYVEHLFAAQLIPLYNQLAGMFQNLEADQQDTIMSNIQNVGANIGTTAGNFIKNFFEKIPNILSWFPNAATVLIFSLLGTFFISKDWYRLSALSNRLLPNRARTSSRTVFIDLKKALFGFVKAQATLISITTVIILIGLLILRIDYAITIALVTGIVDIIPYLGTGAVFVPWIIYEAIAGDMATAIGLGVLYIVVLVQRQVMEPKILSSSIGLDPLATLIALFVGFKTIGFLGLIVGPVVLVVFNTLQRANVFQDVWTFIKGKDEVIIK
ncbi:sporulation integral membrane protein YtvI [Mesobacillus sp. AQ2]|uniref:sporulation integral membrane protein YtvI n=1 Tax=unclassified Mesobacillus TaxID=2675270 RepID=UPI00203CBCDA|nr:MULTISPECIES: sporulation integral membrane protein YtvI [unclassified Mesobacillus]MCM3122694.1 sporulation integral membrane protein YtvI [Mesobacillus sp. MER 33]MCM3232658.1 sporulation integral membrane protein YtvI [Mesobacillus sp. MER 48]WHX39583.1 sporulation integral membrane protein YtvI [Mesobacillus sp. AQ2]